MNIEQYIDILINTVTIEKKKSINCGTLRRPTSRSALRLRTVPAVSRRAVASYERCGYQVPRHECRTGEGTYPPAGLLIARRGLFHRHWCYARPTRPTPKLLAHTRDETRYHRSKYTKDARDRERFSSRLHSRIHQAIGKGLSVSGLWLACNRPPQTCDVATARP